VCVCEQLAQGRYVAAERPRVQLAGVLESQANALLTITPHKPASDVYIVGQMVKFGPAGMRACSLGLVRLGFRYRDKVRVRVSDGVRVSTFYFLSNS